jgi:gas vesicle protein
MDSDQEQEEQGKKKGNKVDKLVAGMIIGGAIGSVLGMTLSPKSGKENRDYIKRKSRETWQKSKLLLGEVISRDEKKKGFWHTLNRLIFRKKDGKS